MATTLGQKESAYLIRSARPKDAPSIAHVHIESWKTTYVGILPESVLNALSFETRAAFWRELLEAPAQDSVTLVATDPTGAVVGFISGGKERTGQLGRDGELYAIYLLRAAQRQGIGTLLVRCFVQEMRLKGFTSMVVWVLDLNPSKKFYEALGGRVIAEKYMERDGRSYLEVALGWEALSI